MGKVTNVESSFQLRAVDQKTLCDQLEWTRGHIIFTPKNKVFVSSEVRPFKEARGILGDLTEEDGILLQKNFYERRVVPYHKRPQTDFGDQELMGVYEFFKGTLGLVKVYALFAEGITHLYRFKIKHGIMSYDEIPIRTF